MEAQFGVAKVGKYATKESGDTLEVIERPQGGMSAVLVDGQRSGRAAKIISNIVARKAISLLGEGVRDGAAVRATHDYLRTHRRGQVSAELVVVSVDLQSRTLVISRNTRCPGLIVCAGQLEVLNEESRAIGIYAHTKPVIREMPLCPDTYVTVFTDGLRSAGERTGDDLDIEGIVMRGAADHRDAQSLADCLLEAALGAERRRPRDDISVLTLALMPRNVPDGVRRLSVSFPM